MTRRPKRHRFRKSRPRTAMKSFQRRTRVAASVGMLCLCLGAIAFATLQSHAPVRTPASSDPGLLIEPGYGIPSVHVGMTESELPGIWSLPSKSRHRADFDWWHALESRNSGISVIVLEGRVVRVEFVISPEILGDQQVKTAFHGRTAKGIGIGSTVQEVIAAYGLPDPVDAIGLAASKSERRNYSTLGIEFAFDGNDLWLITVYDPNFDEYGRVDELKVEWRRQHPEWKPPALPDFGRILREMQSNGHAN